MPTLAVTGGKGGTGKSTVALNLAVALVRLSNESIDLLDLDVECPDISRLLGVNLREVKKVYKSIPLITSKCAGCGVCVQRCLPKALYLLNGRANLTEDLCEGCMLCKDVCPFNAIEESKKEVGQISVGNFEGVNIIEGKLSVGEDESARVIREAMNFSTSSMRVIDTAAGTHCTVVKALKNASHAFIVTEPTPFGINDSALAISLVEKLGIGYDVILNRAGVSDVDLPFKPKFEIPYSEELVQAYVIGKPIVLLDPESEVSKVFMEMAEYARSILFSD